MSLEQVIARIQDRNIGVLVEDGELVIRAPQGVMDTETLALLKTHKQALLKALQDKDGNESQIILNRSCLRITPEKLPLVELSQIDIDNIVATVPGGAANIQDIYPLSPLQEGILFHHVLDTQGDTYLLRSVLAFESRDYLDRFIEALQQVINRHDILRSAVFWQDLSQPIQVVFREASLPVHELEAEADDALARLLETTDPCRVRLGFQRAPLLAAYTIAAPQNGEWLLALLNHHIVCDHISLEFVIAEIRLLLQGRSDQLTTPVPYRNFIAQLRAVSSEQHDAYFRRQLGDVREPTIPFGLLDVKNAGAISEAHLIVPDTLAQKIRAQAKQYGVSSATLFHAAWARVLAQSCGKGDVVFGTVLTGRMQGASGVERTLGMFINTLPVRINIGDISIRHSIAKIHSNLSELLAHEQASLSLAQRCSGVDAALPLFTSLLNYRHSPRNEDASVAWNGMRVIVGGEERTNYPITLSVDDFGDGFGLTLQCIDSSLSDRLITYVLTSVKAIIEALTVNPNLPMFAISVVAEDEERQILKDWNATKVVYPQGRCIHQLFEAQVEQTPDAIALTFEDQSLSYAELNAKANQLAHYLIERGVGPDVLVGICIERSLEMAIGLLGILKAGGAYVPLDPSYPEERLAFMLADIKPIVVLTQAQFASRELASSEVLRLDSDWVKVESYPVVNPCPELQPMNLAYCIYTSGSTGQPKGAGVPHQGILNRLQWMQAEYHLDSTDHVLQKTPYSFDVSVWEFFWPLMTGARLIVAPPELHKDSQGLIELIRREHITTIHFVPSMLQAYVDTPDVEQCTSLKRVICSGEALSTDLVQRFQQKLPAELHNLYGPTEASVDVSYWACPPDCAETAVPIGKPIANIQLHILDRSLNPVPVGTPGELHIAGIGLGRGYLNRPGLTAEKFIPDPFGPAGSRLYKTGDLVRYRLDGNIDYLGRIDHQVKIRGFRIELGEIEAQLLKHEGIKEAVVLAREDQPGDKRLVVYLVEEQLGTLQVDELKAQLKHNLPDYMIPSAFVVLEQMPLSANGKLDRKKLPAPDITEQLKKTYVAPRIETEATLASVFERVLGLDIVGIDDNFFELGGDSIRSLQIINAANKLGFSLSLADLYKTPTIREIVGSSNHYSNSVELLSVKRCFELVDPEDLAKIPKMVEDAYPLTMLQAGMIFHSEYDQFAYHLIDSARLKCKLDVNVLKQAIYRIIHRHPALRTCFDFSSYSVPLQLVYRADTLPNNFFYESWQGLTEEEQVQKFSSWFEQEKECVFDICRSPLIRFYAHKLNSEEFQFTVVEHHAILDGWSLVSMLNELFSNYLSALDQSSLSDRSENDISVTNALRDLVVWERAAIGSDVCRNYWLEKVIEATCSLLPSYISATSPDIVQNKQYHQATGRLSEVLNINVTESLLAQSKKLFVPIKTLLLTAHLKVLGMLYGERSVVSGLVCSTRPEVPGADQSLGVFLNTLPFVVNLNSSSWRELIQHTFDSERELMRYRFYPLAQIQREYKKEGLFDVMFHYLDYHVANDLMKSNDLKVLKWDEHVDAINTLSVAFLFDSNTLKVRKEFLYDKSKLTGEQVQKISAYYDVVLADIVQNIDLRHDRASFISSIEGQLLEAWNTTEVECPQDRCIHQLFEAQADKTPDTIALSLEGDSLSYAELNAKANQLAHYLIERGVGPDILVGICLKPSLEMVIGLLGILKAGGAYVPLDPHYPPERRMLIMADANVKLLLTCEALNSERTEDAEVVVGYAADLMTRDSIIHLDRDGPTITKYPATNPSVSAHPLHLAYLIYTSGSTGRPKGVAVNHRNAVHSTWARLIGYPEPVRAYLLLSSFAFDSSVAGIFWTLAQGGCLCLPHEDSSKDPVALAALIERHDISHVLALPSLYAVLLEQSPQALSRLQIAIVAGETCPTDVVKRHLAVLPDAKLYNEYGPTEGTVWSSVYLAGPDDLDRPLAIGRPIANVRLYNLDQSLNPVPVGVAGELYIGGAGIVPGYWQRPELTAERFIPDPFDPAGGRLYKTGDLVRHRNDGALEFLGRLDHQVKIRGFRIELGEIEAQLLQQPAIKDAVVVAREDQPGDKRLVAYVVPHTAVTDTEAEQAIIDGLKAQLKQHLPDYMIPNAFLVLNTMPLSANGKLDRMQLPAPDLSKQLKKTYVAPRTETEQALAEIWREVLGVEQVGIKDDFFELGGHSLLATQLAFACEKRLQKKFPVKTVFEHPTVARQTAWLAGDISDTNINLLADTQLGCDIYPLPTNPLPLDQSGAVMLTGATGFLGAFLLVELLERTDANVYCLVRAENETQATARLQTQLMRYELYDRVDWSRVIAVCGDLGVERLGLNGERYREISATADAIFHNGALVNFVQPYGLLKPANVFGSVEVLRMAATERPKAIHYISTLSVFAGKPGNPTGFAETDEPLLNEGLTGGYAQSKWVAEAIVRSAGNRGFFTTIYRPATVAGDRRNGVWNTDDFLCRILKGCVQMGLAPDSDAKLEMATVDDISRAVVALAKADFAENRIFHLNHPKSPTANALLDWLAANGFSLRKVPMPEWLHATHLTAETMDDFALKPLLGLFVDEPIDSPADVENGYTCLTTQRALRALGTEYGEFDDTLLGRYRDYFLRSGFRKMSS
ncbi:non-ribosomal peptide synthetase [Methylomonas methanica]|uniref:Amino acid adenylation domain protein n=1 Tax=Methylomonas methanica (strain DSM 25384 / MC09) TaxID=857087 RepID=G0A7P6_METMM|nr:non-ribosomal peptide synthetase [Methylomonas methanica]AEG01889.1 amino acid adenylation domain protein [Methylomonas methanica MC09]